jgi:hypothetical protein
MVARDSRGLREKVASWSAEVSASGSKRQDLRTLPTQRASKEACIQSISDICPLEHDDESTSMTDLMKRRASEDGVR